MPSNLLLVVVNGGGGGTQTCVLISLSTVVLSDILLKPYSLYFDIHSTVMVIVYMLLILLLCGFFPGKHLTTRKNFMWAFVLEVLVAKMFGLPLPEREDFSCIVYSLCYFLYRVWALYLRERVVSCMPLYAVSPQKVQFQAVLGIII
jgi:hypothetical protein